MRPALVLGLGNPLAGDDGVGWHLARRLRHDPRLPDGTDVRTGDDLLRLQDDLPGRRSLVLLDAFLDSGPPGTLLSLPLDTLDDRASAHLLGPAHALRLLRAVDPRLESLPVTLLGIRVRSAHIGSELSPQIQARLGSLTDAVLTRLRSVL